MQNINIKEVLKNMTILYIEDEKSIRENLTKMLTLLFKKCLSFENGKDAINYFENNKVDILLTDINLVDINGIDIIKKIRQTNEDIPIILLTAYLETDYLLDAIKYEVTEYLNKPINFELLLKSFEKAAKKIVSKGNYFFTLNNNLEYRFLNKELFDKENNKSISLTSNELKFFELLIKNSNRVVTYDEIKNEVWSNSLEVTDSAFKNLLTKLRQKIGKDIILNISKVGYKLNI
ncbi:transcriptional regulator [Malaciobacter molluscorum LMG 25693]|uniref:Transcriptional regulator n=2 Tax=Malaciobacter molluscorum TaxID=1032072 RepID=A0A2G1DGN9_9BACT|nr:response regulator transcription factor [Malaciobacter molluscorum]AXX93480.1 two-component system response regulator [Malaciobacter molluscorum LMG 25693]PHO17506.1 transcriptional regulator [Malaciobacter molluscorum LMG 25693]